MTDEPLGWPDLLGMGAASAVMLAGGAALGWWLDNLLNTSPILVIVGIALGIAGGVCYSIFQIRSFLK